MFKMVPIKSKMTMKLVSKIISTAELAEYLALL